MAEIIDYFDYTRGPECFCQVRDRGRARRLKRIRRRNAWRRRVEFITGKQTVDVSEITALLPESEGPDRAGSDGDRQKRTGAAAPVRYESVYIHNSRPCRCVINDYPDYEAIRKKGIGDLQT